MAKSIKLNDNQYIDTEGVYDSTIGALQSYINSRGVHFMHGYPSGTDLPSAYSYGITLSVLGDDAREFPLNYALIITFRHDNRACQLITTCSGTDSLQFRRYVTGDQWSDWKTIALT